jgi:2-furoyl-CoA dehydrogenase FAD binding subunit
VKPKAFDYLAAATPEEALEALAQAGEDARVLAGGLSLVPMLNYRLVEPGLLIDISRIEALRSIRLRDGAIEIGAATTQAELSAWPELAERAPLLAAALPFLGHLQTRSRGTVCGSLAHADPSSELPLCLATLGGTVILRGPQGERTLAPEAFQLGMLSTARAPDELLTAARFPARKPGEGYAFVEMARRRGDFAIVAVAAVVAGDAVRLGIGGVADRPVVRAWEALDEGQLDDALNAFAWQLGGTDDIHATARYRRELVRRLGRRAIEEARACRA